MTTSNQAKSAAEILSMMNREGITSLESLAQRIAETAGVKARRIDQDTSRPRLALARTMQPEEAARIKHRIPKMVVEVDGVQYDPHDIHRLDGHVLHFVHDDGTDSKQVLHAFKRVETAREHIASLKPATSAHALPPHVPGRRAWFYQHDKHKGFNFSLEYRHAAWDLREVNMWSVLWWGENWNDQISSLKSGEGVTLYEDIHWGGSSLTFSADRDIPSLSPYGWNDRVSSIEH